MWMGIFKKLFDLMLKDIHKLDQEIFIAKARSSEAEDLGETLFEDKIKEEQSRVEEVHRIIQAKREELDEVYDAYDVPLKYQQSNQQPPKKYRAARKLYNEIKKQVDELVSIQCTCSAFIGMRIFFVFTLS